MVVIAHCHSNSALLHLGHLLSSNICLTIYELSDVICDNCLSLCEHQILILSHSNTFCPLRVRYRKYLSSYPNCFIKKSGTSKDPFPTKIKFFNRVLILTCFIYIVNNFFYKKMCCFYTFILIKILFIFYCTTIYKFLYLLKSFLFHNIYIDKFIVDIKQ